MTDLGRFAGRTWLVGAMLLAGGAAASGATTWYVAPTGSDLNSGSSSAKFATIGRALTAAGASGDTINVAAGSYAESTTITKTVKFAGGAATVAGVAFASGGALISGSAGLSSDHVTFDTTTHLGDVVLISTAATISVPAGTYPAMGAVKRAVTLDGAQAGVDARGRTGASETIIDLSLGTTKPSQALVISSPNVVVDGFTVVSTNTNVASRQDGLVASSPSALPAWTGVEFLNNRVIGQLVGTDDNGSNNAIYVGGASALVEHNYINGWRNGINGGSDKGTTSTADDVPVAAKIRENEIVGVKYGIGCYTDGAVITKNFIHDSTYTAGFNNGIQGEYFNTEVSDNVVQDITGMPDASAGIVLYNSKITSRPSSTSVTLTNNSMIRCPLGLVVASNQDLTKQDVRVRNCSFDGDTTGAQNESDYADGSILTLTNCWYGDSSGPSGPGGVGGSGVPVSAGIVVDGYVGQNGATGHAAIVDDTPQTLGAASGSTTVSLTITPDSGDGAGHSLDIDADSAPYVSGYAGFYGEKGIAGTVSVNTTLPDGEFVATVSLAYDPTLLAAAGISHEEGLTLMVWDAVGAQWVLAVSKNIDPARNDRGVSAPTGVLGDYGVDTTAHVVWAVVDHASVYASGAKDNGALPVTVSEFVTE